MGFFFDIFGECFLIQNRHRLRYRRLWRRCNRFRCSFLCHARLSFACKQFVNRYAEKLRNLRHCCYIRQTVAGFPFRHGAVAYIQLLCKLCLRQACVFSHFCYKFAYFGVVHIFNLALSVFRYSNYIISPSKLQSTHSGNIPLCVDFY